VAGGAGASVGAAAGAAGGEAGLAAAGITIVSPARKQRTGPDVPGMVMTWAGFAARSASTVTPKRAAMRGTVSPAPTTWVEADVAATVGGDAGRSKPWTTAVPGSAAALAPASVKSKAASRSIAAAIAAPRRSASAGREGPAEPAR
jgi:hypothetical protein